MVAFACLLLEDECLFLQIAKLRDWVRRCGVATLNAVEVEACGLHVKAKRGKYGGLGLWFRPEQEQHHRLDADFDCHFTESFLCIVKHNYRGRGK
jgi:hypothetical protein